MDGEEASLMDSCPVTDIAYFGAGISDFGKLVGVPPRARLKNFKGKVHLVVAETGNAALTHFCLDPGYPLREALVADIAAAAQDFDGVQIDFEAVNTKDYEAFYGFLGTLKAALGTKTLSVALPARTSEKTDRFGYERIGKLADRVVIMAYDEHWSSSAPGPVASIAWCRQAAGYALSKIPAGKLVMGCPFYGRAWTDKSLSRAYKYSGIARLFEDKGIAAVQRKGDIPVAEYEESVKVFVYFDDAASILARLSMYSLLEVRNIAFWRLGQEDPGIWARLAAAPQPLPDQPEASASPAAAAQAQGAAAATLPAAPQPTPAAPTEAAKTAGP
jgi:spore germination protein YaaH